MTNIYKKLPLLQYLQFYKPLPSSWYNDCYQYFSDMKVIVNLFFVLFLLITHSTSSPTSKRRPNTPFSAPKYPEWVQPILDAMVDSVKMNKVRSSIAPR